MAFDPVDPKNAESIVYFRDNFNVNFEVEISSGDPTMFEQRMRLLATSGDLPDIIYHWGSGSTFLEFVDEGFLLELTDEIFNMAPMIRTMFSDYELDRYNARGARYLLPMRIQGAYNAVYVRGDWLEKLGIDQPTTLEEFEDMLRQFTYGDPDGNGLDDTYGWGERNLIGGNFTAIFGAFGFIPQFWQEYEGKVYYGFTHPKIFEPLELLQRWYAEKLIDPEWITTTTDDWWGKIATDKLGAFTAGIGSYNGIMGRITPNNPDGYIVAIPAPAGPSGKGGIHTFGDMTTGASFNKNIKNIERMMEIVNHLYDEDVAIRLAIGEDGKEVNYLEEGGYEWIVDDDYRRSTGLGWYPIMMGSANTMGLTPYGSLNLFEKVQTTFEKDAFAKYQPVGIGDVFLGWTAPPSDVNLAEKYGDINSILLQGLFEVVCGKAPVADYQKYIDNWYASGGDEYTEAANANYQLMLSERFG